jgi:hypothetical protein
MRTVQASKGPAKVLADRQPFLMHTRLEHSMRTALITALIFLSVGTGTAFAQTSTRSGPAMSPATPVTRSINPTTGAISPFNPASGIVPVSPTTGAAPPVSPTTGVAPAVTAPSPATPTTGETATPSPGPTSAAGESALVASPPVYPQLPNTDRDLGHTRQDIDKDSLAQCYREWDPATHMTKQEWARTCHWTLTRFKNLPADVLSYQPKQRSRGSAKTNKTN